MPSASDVWWYPTNMHRHWPLWYLHVLFGVWWWIRDVEPQVWQIPRTLECWDYLEGTSGKFWMEAHFREWRQVPGGRLPAGHQGSWKCWYVLDAHNGQVHEGNLIPGKFYSRFRIILNCFIWLFCKWALFIHDTHTPTKTSKKACWFLNQSNHQGSWSNAFPRAWRPVNVFHLIQSLCYHRLVWLASERGLSELRVFFVLFFIITSHLKKYYWLQHWLHSSVKLVRYLSTLAGSWCESDCLRIFSYSTARFVRHQWVGELGCSLVAGQTAIENWSW